MTEMVFVKDGCFDSSAGLSDREAMIHAAIHHLLNWVISSHDFPRIH